MEKITVTPLEALRRLYDVARKVDAKESGEFETLLQGELLVAETALRVGAAPVVPVAAQPVVPEGWKLVPQAPTPKMVDATWNDSLDGMSHNARNKKIYGAMLAAAPQPAASVIDVAKDAVAYAIFKVMKTANMIDKDWHGDVILGLDNEFRNQINQAAQDAIDAAIAAQQGEKT